MKQRIFALDNLKGILIILVVVGHCIQFTTNDFDNVALFRFIYAFHMPLFMWVSGFVNYHDGATKLSILKRRAIQLALPFLSWTLLNYLITCNPHHLVDVFFNPTLSVWFVWDLFLIICFSTTINYLCDKYGKSSLKYTIIAFVVAEVIVKGLHLEILDISHSLDMGIFYLMGYFMHKYQVFNKFIDTQIGGGILAMFFIMCLFWQRKLPPTFIPDAPNAIGTLWKMLTATFACCSIPLFFMRLAEKNIKVITYLGRQTLGIYVVHQTLLALFVKLLESYGLPYWCLVSLLAILTIIVSQIINVLLQKNSVTGFVMLGKR